MSVPAFIAAGAVPRRPALRWHGGKWRLAPWIISHLPRHRIYVEPYGGAASVLLRKPRSYAEVYNDLDDEVVGFFRVLQDPASAARLIELLRLTPFARREFEISYAPSDDPVERARRLVIRSFMGFGSNAHASENRGHRSTGFRGCSNRSGTTPAMDWASYPAAAVELARRLAGVVIESRPALQVMQTHDEVATLHYVDPPYMHETRAPSRKGKRALYRFEMTDEDHAELLAFLRALKGMVVLSGYASPLYDAEMADWQRVECPTFADGAQPRNEVLWINPAAVAALGHGPLFAEAAE